MKHYEQGGSLPVWELSGYETSCMIGYHSAPVIYDAFVKGIAPYDHARMLEALVHSARTRWRGLPEFAACGYIPADAENESVSKALEYAYDDWCIAQFARATGNEAVWREFTDRSQYYKNILDPDGFMHARINGAFTEPFNPCELNATLTEANSWQYSTSVTHDADTYIALLGGEKTAERFFDSLFGTPAERIKGLHPDVTGLIGQYAHGNEPSHHVAYWYNFTGSPDKTARIARRIMNEFYSSRPDGICGNDDCGQMSAWYVASAIGFYPFCPGSNIYPLGSPIFDRITVRLENGKQFVVRCLNQSDRNIFIRSARLNGHSHRKSFIEYDDLKDGGELVLEMSDTPGADFGRAPEDRPHTRVESTITLTPRFSIPHKTFADSATLSMYLYQPSRRDDNLDFAFPAATDAIYYTLDGSEPDTSSTLYTAPVPVRSDITVKAAAYSKTTGYSKTVVAGYTRYARDKDILSQTACTPAYDGGGDNALVDGRRGGKIFNLGEWRGYEGKDIEAVVDLRATRNIVEAGAGFIQDLGVWIVFPAEVTFEISDDNVSYRHYGTVKSSIPPESRHAQTLDYVVRKPARARYLRVRVKHYGKMPSWHVGTGLNSHLFIDEIFIR
jgi:hypothetical protein